jgi:hypothetical protein
MLVFVLDKMGVRNMKQGAMNSLWITLLIALSYDSYFWASTNLYTSMEVICVDVLVSAVTGAIVGGVIGWMLGMNSQTDSTS